MKKRWITVLLALVVLTLAALPTIKEGSAATETRGERAYFLADYNGGTVVASKNEEKRLPIASMVKITSLAIVFDAIEEGRLSLDDKVSVSERAASMGGSQAFLDAGATHRAEDLIKSVVVASANDSCVALAEHLEGSVEHFVAKMNEKAQELGMENTSYANCTGLPDPNGYSCAKDVATITRYLMRHEAFFDYAKIWMYDFEHENGRVTGLTNTNKLVRFYDSMDGGKTGFTKEALSCLSCRATKKDTSLVCVVIGAPDSKSRNARVCELLNEGFAQYESVCLARKGDDVEESAIVRNGKKDRVGVVYGESLKSFGKKGAASGTNVEIILDEMKAPVVEGDRVGHATYLDSEGQTHRVDLLAKESVGAVNWYDIVKKMAENW